MRRCAVSCFPLPRLWLWLWLSFSAASEGNGRVKRELRFPRGASLAAGVALASFLPKGPTDGLAHVVEFDLGFPFPKEFAIDSINGVPKSLRKNFKLTKKSRGKKRLKEDGEIGRELLFKLEDAVNRSAALKYNDLGLKKYLEVEFDDAIADYTRAIELDPGLAVAYYNRGTVHYRLGNYESALGDLAKAVNLEPQNAEFVEGLRDCRKMCEDAENSQ